MEIIQILHNPNDENLGPWFAADFEDPLRLPLWNFVIKDLRRLKLSLLLKRIKIF